LKRIMRNKKVLINMLFINLIIMGSFTCNSMAAAFVNPGSGIEHKNLLRNASFMQSTNQSIPDYWDLNHAAAVTFRDLHHQYFISDTVASPVPQTKTLVIVNNVKDFYHVMLLPRIFFQRLPEGSYTFSVYTKAERNGAELVIYKAWGDSELLTKKILTNQWERYSVTFTVDNSSVNPPQPIMCFPSKAKYFIAAPQLEYGTSATEFRPSPEDSSPANSLNGFVHRGSDMNFNNTQVLKGRREAAPIIGKNMYTVTAQNKTIGKQSISVVLNRVAENPRQVRVTNRRYLKINNAPFFIIGMDIGWQYNLPDWYFDDLAAHGINTLFLAEIRNSRGTYDLTRIKNILMKANDHGFKVVLGRPLMGSKDSDWRQKNSAFKELIENLKNDPTIIAWMPVDEPAANTWNDSELLEIYNGIKQIDPYRPVFINWAYDGVPAAVGAQPRGTLKATDFYSMDYYPFAWEDRSLSGFAQYSVRMMETARIFNKIPHSWIQLYGGMDAWREPCGDELNYMVYMNLIYGSMFSYFNTKSNSPETWRRVAQINQQAKTLASSLFLNPDAREIQLPKIDKNFIYSIWITDKKFFVITLHNGEGNENLDFDLSGLVGSKAFSVRSLFEKRKVAFSGKHIKEIFSPYQSRVYVVNADR